MAVQDPQVPSRPGARGASRSPRRRVRGAALLVAAVTGLGLVGAPVAATAAPARATYQNPVSRSFADTFADPSIIEAKDGWWYAYSTADPLRAGDEPGIMHIARTRDFVDWQYQGTVFDDTNRPTWATPTSGLWAPDVRYVDGRYVLYYTVTDTTLDPGDADSAIGVATSPSPTGPWTPSDAPVVAPRTRPGTDPAARDFLWTFDPSGFTDVDGQRYLYFGSYNGGVWATRVSEDGLTATGEPTLVAIDNKFEGSYVVRHGGWYYLMASSANCCAGPTTGYSVFTGRSRSPMGPFVDEDGISLTASRAGGTILVTQNGNRWIGAGHHALATDHAGRRLPRLPRARPGRRVAGRSPSASRSGRCCSTASTGWTAGRARGRAPAPATPRSPHRSPAATWASRPRTRPPAASAVCDQVRATPRPAPPDASGAPPAPRRT